MGIGSGEMSLPIADNFNPLTTSACDDNQDGETLYGVGMPFPGPVEFDQGLAMRWACSKGQIVFYVNQHEAGSSQANTPMYCQFEQQ